ncbi:MAG: peptidylprolyl isomerase [Candidatus Cloacimonetes bacterium]|nr:peptidylprolyl isomerase [Candidatus Cloacimonadota bacterium]
MHGFRKHGKIIIFVVAIIFIVGMATAGLLDIFQPKPYVGKIANKKITIAEFDRVLRNNVASYMEENEGVELNEATLKQLNDKTWNQLIQQIVLDREIKRMGIKVKDKDVVDKMLNDPPDFVKTAPIFQTDGEFDNAKYKEVLASDERIVQSIEMYIRGSLPYERLFDRIKSQVTVSEEEVKDDYIAKNDKADAKIIFFDPKKISDVSVSEEDTKKYYDENKEEFKKDPAAKLKYVKMSLEPSIADKNALRDSAMTIYQMAKSGESFEQLARDYSEDNSAANGGDLGFFGKGKMVPEFETTAFALNVGEISEPVLSQFGYHIIKLEEKRKAEDGSDEVRARHILFKLSASEKTKNDHKLKTDEFYALTKEKGIEAAAKEMALSVSETPEFYENATYISGIGREEALVKFAFDNEVGAVANKIENSRNDVFISEVSFKIGTHYEEYDKAKARIESKIKNERQVAAVIEKAKLFAESNEQSNYLAQATKDGWEIVEAKGIVKDRYITKVGKIDELSTAVLALDNNDCTGLVLSDKGAYIAFVENRIKPDMEKFENEKETLTETMLTNKQNQHYNEWYQDIKEKAKIVDNRAEFNL